MSWSTDLMGFIWQVFDLSDDEIIDVPYPTTSSLHGAIAGTLVRQEGPGPGPRYHFEPAPPDAPRKALAPLVVAHHFEVLTDLAEAARPYPGDVVFLSCPTGCSALLITFDIKHPEAGSCSMSIARHPDFLRWWRAIPMDHPYTDMTHEQLADLVLDNQECLVSRADAHQLARFRYARTIEAASDRTTGDETVKVSFRGSGGKPGAEEDFAIPRDVELSIPAYTGAWPPGEEPRHRAILRLRVVPLKGDSAPLFRASWADAPGFELTAAAALTARVRGVFGERHVYRGAPSAVRYVIPGQPS